MDQLHRTQLNGSDRDGAPDLHDMPLAELLKKLSQEFATLVRQEFELARVEMTAKGQEAGKGVGMFGAAGVLGMLALAAFTACLILALSLVMAGWLAALIIAIAYGIAALVLMQSGKARLKAAAPPVPTQTIETLKEDVQWAKTQTRSDRI